MVVGAAGKEHAAQLHIPRGKLTARGRISPNAPAGLLALPPSPLNLGRATWGHEGRLNAFVSAPQILPRDAWGPENDPVKNRLSWNVRQSLAAFVRTARQNPGQDVLPRWRAFGATPLPSSNLPMAQTASMTAPLGGTEVRVHAVRLSESARSARTLANEIADKLEVDKKPLRALKPFVEALNKDPGVAGFKIKISGRIGGGDMKSSMIEFNGRCSPASMMQRVDWGLSEAFTKTGLLGVRVLLAHTPRRPGAEGGDDAPREGWLDRMREKVALQETVRGGEAAGGAEAALLTASSSGAPAGAGAVGGLLGGPGPRGGRPFPAMDGQRRGLYTGAGAMRWPGAGTGVAMGATEGAATALRFLRLALRR